MYLYDLFISFVCVWKVYLCYTDGEFLWLTVNTSTQFAVDTDILRLTDRENRIIGKLSGRSC